MKRDMKSWFDSLRKGDSRAAMPILTSPGVPLIGASIPELVRDPQVQFRCIEALAKRYPSIAAMTVMDLSVEAEAFGSSVYVTETEVPSVVGRLVSNEEEVVALPVPGIGAGRTGVYLETVRLAVENIADRPVFGGHIGPISLAGRLFDMTEIMLALLAEPDTAHALLEKCCAFLTSYSLAFKAAGANGIIIAEPAAGLLSPAVCEEFSSAYVRRIVEAVQDDSFAVILHNCGNTRNLVSSMAGTGAMGLHFGNAVKMSDILPQIPADLIAFGNVDPVGVFRSGNPGKMRDAVMGLLDATKDFPNYVISSGCDVPPGTPLENINAFFGAVADYTSKSISN